MKSQARFSLLVVSSFIAAVASSCAYEIYENLGDLSKKQPGLSIPQQEPNNQSATAVSLGFDFKSDGFSFANWGASPDKNDFDVQSMVEMFGAFQVCRSFTSIDCELTNSASVVRDRLDKGLSGGYCEGMAVSAGLNYVSRSEGRERPVADDKSKSSRAIAMWWATQVDSRVQSASSTSRKWKPSLIASTVFDAIRDKNVVTMGIYFDGFGHTVLPISATWISKTLAIGVYDPNVPGKEMFIFIDTSNETWSYETYIHSSKVMEKIGGTESGGLDLVSIELRSLPMFAAIQGS